MELETLDVIEVQATSIDSSAETAIPRWYSAAQVQSTLNLNKTALQKAVAKLQNIYGIDLKSLRRGSARATEYSEFALEAIELLNAKKLSELRKLVDQLPAPTSTPQVAGGLVIAEYTPTLDNRIAQLSQTSAATSANISNDIQMVLARIAADNKAAEQRTSDLDAAERAAAQNRGAQRALSVFQIEQEAHNEVLAQLRAMQLGAQQ
ncbi:hypothetical protein QUA27_25385 [Microcoleus sp. Pol14C6]|uniref:hypothetical protein n=1 Tax=unclassified Microcoleus TaxID=2642155 RepID=UPI002FCFF2C0